MRMWSGLLAGMLMGGGLGMWGQSAAPVEHTHMSAPPAAGTVAAEVAKPVAELSLIVEGRSTPVTMAEMAAMPQRTVTVKNAHTKMEETYSGVAVSDLLERRGLVYTGHERQVYHSYVRVTGADGYWVLYSASETERGVHAGEVMVATARGGQPLGKDGPFQLISTEDVKPARWVRNVTGIELKTVE